MKNYTTRQLHDNFIMLHAFQHSEPIKAWVANDKNYTGVYHSDWETLFEIVKHISDTTGYELVIRYDNSYWNKFGENPLRDKKGNEVEFGGYKNIKNIYEAVVEFVKWYKK